MAKGERAPERRISARQAAKNASLYLGSLVDQASDILVEESELGEDGEFWSITLSYSIGMAFGPKEYKLFKVDAKSGEVLSMKIRKS